MRAALSVFVLAWCAVVSAAAQQAAPANETPGQFYQRYRAAVPAAATVEEIVAFWSADQRADGMESGCLSP